MARYLLYKYNRKNKLVLKTPENISEASIVSLDKNSLIKNIATKQAINLHSFS